jgi:hypothetical protein
MGIISEIQAAAKVFQQAGQIDLYQKLLAHLEKAFEIGEENRRLGIENAELKEELRLKDTLTFRDDAYWVENEKKEVIDGPFCPRCRDSLKKLIHLISCPDPGYSECPECRVALPIRFGKPWKNKPFLGPPKTEDDDRF